MVKAGKIFAVALAVVIIIIAAIYIVGTSKLNDTYQVSESNNLLETIQSDSASVARGQHLANINGCTDCHGPTLAGKIMVDEPPFFIASSNLTSGKGGIGGKYSDTDLDRVLRYGVKPTGEPILIMPSKTYHNLSDQDANDILAYVKSVPPVDLETPQREIHFLGRILIGLGEIDPAEEVHLTTGRNPKPAEDTTAVFGKYLASITCNYCHGGDLKGRPNPQNPDLPIPSLARVAAWDFETFKKILKTGQLPEGRKLDESMPVSIFRHYTDSEMKAIYAYVSDEVK